MVASMAMEAGGVKRRLRARAAIGGVAVWFFAPMKVSPCAGFGCYALDRKRRTRGLARRKRSNSAQCPHLAHRLELPASLACNNNDLAISDNYFKFKISSA
jgi:hypothetical protein